MPCHTIPYHTILYHTIPYHTIPYHTRPDHAMLHHTIPYHAILYHTIPYHTIPVWYGIVWYGMVLYGMVWYGMVWLPYGIVWYGMAWYGLGFELLHYLDWLHVRILSLRVFKNISKSGGVRRWAREHRRATGMGFWVFADRNLLLQSRAGGSEPLPDLYIKFPRCSSIRCTTSSLPTFRKPWTHLKRPWTCKFKKWSPIHILPIPLEN